jgi:predicted DNA-binding transcriptional regulator AlpA
MDRNERKRTKRRAPPPSGFRIYTAADIRAILGISRTTMWEWALKGHLPAARQIGPGPNARRGWPSPEFERWLMSRPTVGVGLQGTEASA